MSLNPRGSFVRDPEDHAIVQAVAAEKESFVDAEAGVVEHGFEGSEGSDGSESDRSDGSDGSATITTTRRGTPGPVRRGKRNVQFNTDIPVTPRFERSIPWRQRIQHLRSLRYPFPSHPLHPLHRVFSDHSSSCSWLHSLTVLWFCCPE
jgi:hypothetical protein